MTVVRTLEQAIADAQATIRAYDRSGRRLRALTADTWNAIGDRCLADAVKSGANHRRYKASITLAALCYAKARGPRRGKA